MRITLQTHGGIAAAIPRRPLHVETGSLPDEDAHQLKQLVASVVTSARPPDPASIRPDAMTYTLTVEDGAGVQTVKQHDANLTPEFSNLLGQLMKHSGAATR